MTHTHELVQYCDQLLAADGFEDYAPNGLQVQGRAHTKTLATAVTASLATIEAAVGAEIDTLLVHHGYFWKGEKPQIVGMKAKRIEQLLGAQMNLVAYHLPLDTHAQLGNNACLAQSFDAIDVTAHRAGGVEDLLWQGSLRAPLSAEAFSALITARLGREPLHLGDDKPISSLAWCSGGAQDFIDQAADLGVDAYISGEVSERTTHIARERGIQYFAAGHHATERGGVRALGDHLAQRFDLSVVHIEDDNPV